EERKRALKDLAEEQKQLEEEAKKKVRELAQLNANDASKSLDQAARKMEKAGNRLNSGDDPDEEQKDAKKEIDQAKKDLQKSLEETEEALAREQIAKIADKLKGLKERQDEAIERLNALHKELLRQQHWGETLQKKLSARKDDQLGLATETAGLQEQLTKAKALVFAHILEKTVSAMKGAGKEMEKRLKESAFREDDLTKNQVADENKKQEATLALQKEASRRLERLIEALKNDKKKDAKDPDGKK